MEKAGRKQKIIYGMLALLCFGILIAVPYVDKGKEEKQSVYMVVFGDSVLGQYRDETSVPAQIGRLLGKEVFNGALGGTSMGRQDQEMRLGYTKDMLSMTGLSVAVAADDFGPQQTVRMKESATEYFAETIDDMEKIDFEEVEVFLLGHGMNDYHAGMPIYPDEDAYDEYTFAGALRSAIRNLREAYPEARIVLATPAYSWYTLLNITCEEYNTGGGLLEAYVEAEMAVAKEMDVEIIDLYHDVYTHDTWEDWELYTRDGLHPNSNGRRLLAERIAAYFQANPQKPDTAEN